VGELAERTGLHENTVRDHLNVLVSEGWVLRRPGVPAGRGRPRLRFQAATGRELRTDPEAAARLDRSVHDALRVQAVLGVDHRSGDAPGTLTRSAEGDRQVLALFAHLDGLGTEPTLSEDGEHLDLWHCPHDVPPGAGTAPACRVHLALAREVLEQAGGPVTAAALHPHAVPGPCRVVLRDAGADPGPHPART
jgi:predicted ArsR family transcriptional regulator